MIYIYTGDIIYTAYDSSPPSCGLLVKISNTSLRIKDECLIFHDDKNLFQCEQINKTKKNRIKTVTFPYSKSETSFEPHMSLVNFLLFDVFRFKGGWVGTHPFSKGQHYPPYFHCVHPPKRWGYLHGYTGIKTPENITQSSSPMSATLW